MAKRPENYLRKSQAETKALLNAQIEQGKELRSHKIYADRVYNSELKIYDRWRKFTLTLLESLFTNDDFIDDFSEYADEHEDDFGGMDTRTLREATDDYYEQLEAEIHSLESIVERLVLIDELPKSRIIKIASASETDNEKIKGGIQKVFVSHSFVDQHYVAEIVDLLEIVGLRSDQIFCTSFDGYGIELGENFLERIKHELDENILVLFILSENFYKSPVCLCEMGATWIKTNQHIPILIPPLDFGDVKGVIPMTQGFKLNDGSKLNSLKEKIEKLFNLTPIDHSGWEKKRDRILGRLKRLVE